MKQADQILHFIERAQTPPMPTIGRVREQEFLKQVQNSKKAEFIAVYGRRRVGKTHLIRETFKAQSDVFFYVTGQQNGKQAVQLLSFKQAVEAAFQLEDPLPLFKSWREAFEMLTTLTETYIQKFSPNTVVFFFDELPWLATPRSNLIEVLDLYWNTRWSLCPQLRVFICGSAATWMIREILENTGGLHNRVTGQIRLEPFTLKETHEFLSKGGTRSGKVSFVPKQILEIYMALGGIPAYLAHIQPGLSVAQNIGQLCFGKQAPLRDEFDRLFKSLFKNSEAHRKIIRAMASKRIGLNREEISAQAKISSGGVLTEYLRELEESGFIEGFMPYLKQKNERHYRLIDEFSWFYLKWMEPAPQGSLAGSGMDYWLAQFRQPGFISWSGYSFESICLKHIGQIRTALQCSSIPAKLGPWYSKEKGHEKKSKTEKRTLSEKAEAAQVDLVIDRDDGVINLLEMKYSSDPYVLTSATAREMLRKVELFAQAVETKKQIVPVLVSPFGLKPGPWNEEIFPGGVVRLDALL